MRKHSAPAPEQDNVYVEVDGVDSSKRRPSMMRHSGVLAWAVALWLTALTVWLLVLTVSQPAASAIPELSTRDAPRNRHVRFNTTLGRRFEVYAPGMTFERVERYEMCCRTATALICGPHTGVRGRVVAPKLVHVEVRAASNAGAECVFRWHERGD